MLCSESKNSCLKFLFHCESEKDKLNCVERHYSVWNNWVLPNNVNTRLSKMWWIHTWADTMTAKATTSRVAIFHMVIMVEAERSGRLMWMWRLFYSLCFQTCWMRHAFKSEGLYTRCVRSPHVNIQKKKKKKKETLKNFYHFNYLSFFTSFFLNRDRIYQ